MADFQPLWDGGPLFAQSRHFALSTDSVLLADFVRIGQAKKGVDLGCGSGILPLLLLSRSRALRMTGLELLPDAAALARENLAVNGLTERADVVTGDLRQHRALFAAGSFDLVVANPPYYPPADGLVSPDPERAAARSELTATLEEVCAAAAWLCRSGGRFHLVHKPDRLPELFACLKRSGFEPKRLRLVCHSPDAAPSLCLLEARRGGAAGLRVEPCLFLRDLTGAETAEARRIYHKN